MDVCRLQYKYSPIKMSTAVWYTMYHAYHDRTQSGIMETNKNIVSSWLKDLEPICLVYYLLI